jgi:hypothetical protein
MILKILIILFIYFLFFLINNFLKLFERFSNNEGITFKFSNSVGFYSNLFFVMNSYIYCYKNNLYFNIDDTDWIFTKNKGWEDYFLNINLNRNKKNNNLVVKQHSEICDNIPIYEYKKIIPKFYRYNNKTIFEINKIKKKFNLFDNNYDSIFIRRGDKLTTESKYIPTEKYFNFLLKINPNCKKIFLQTDDYNCFIDLQKLVKDKNIDILYLGCSNYDNINNVFDKIDQIENYNLYKPKKLLKKVCIGGLFAVYLSKKAINIFYERFKVIKLLYYFLTF